MFIYFFFFKEQKKCICGSFQLDAVVPEKHLYFFLALCPINNLSVMYYNRAGSYWVEPVLSYD